MASTQTLTELPEIQYTGMDYKSVLNQIEKIINDNPNWKENWTNFYASEAGTMLIQLMAWICDNLGVRQDLLYNEMFLSTAKDDTSKTNLLKQIGYYTGLPVAATIPVTITLDSRSSEDVIVSGSESASKTSVNDILSFVANDNNGATAQYEILKTNSDGVPDYTYQVALKASNGSIEFSEDLDGNKITALQGKTKYKDFTSNTRNGPYFDLDDSNIAYNSIRVFDVDDDMQEHRCVDSFTNINVRDSLKITPSYIIERNEYNNIRIRYPSESIMTYDGQILDEMEISGKVKHRMYIPGHKIRVFYRVTEGAIGNIPTGFINTTVKLKDSTGKNSITATIYNEATGYGGKNAETLDEAVKTAPLTLKTLNRAVTSEDYDNIIGNSSLILKSRSYSPSNEPASFKEYFGRKINPQEVFSFVIMNKNYNNLSGDNYNNFPWIDTNKIHMLNEEYMFGNSQLNETAQDISDSFFNYYLINDNNTTDWFRNGTVVNTGSEVANAFYLDGTKEVAKIKIHKNKSDEIFIDNIKPDLMASSVFDKDIEKENIKSNLRYENGDYILTDTLTYNNPIIVNNNVSALCISNPIKELKEDKPINCINFEKVEFVLDGLVDTEINIHAEKDVTKNYKSYYILVDNPDPITLNENTANIDSEDYAMARYGLKQLINNQMLGLTRSSDLKYRLYDGKHAYQQLNLNAQSKSSESSLGEGYCVLKIMGNVYALLINNDTFRKAIDYFENLDIEGTSGAIQYKMIKSFDDEAFIDSSDMYYEYVGNGKFVNKVVSAGDVVKNYYQKLEKAAYNATENKFNSLVGIAEQLQYEFNLNLIAENTSDVPLVYKLINDNGNWKWVEYTGTELADIKVECVTKTNYNTDYSDDDNVSFNDNNSYDLLFSTTSSCDNIKEKFGNYIVEDYDEIIDSTTITTHGFLEELGAQKNEAVCSSYSNVADAGYIYGKYRFVIKSPTTGINSSIFFKRGNRKAAEDLMSYLGVTYDSLGRSKKAYGQKKVTLFLKNCISATQNSSTLDVTKGEEADNPDFGSIIFTSNDLNNTFKIGGLYLSYKLNNSDSIIINHYDNYYYSDNKEITEKMKPEIIGIEGQSVYSETNDLGITKYKIDKYKSNFDVRLSLNKQPTNSLFNIDKQEGLKSLGVIENGRTKITTANITKTNYGIAEEIPLVFSIDDINSESGKIGSFDQLRCLYFNAGIVDDITGNSLYNDLCSYLRAYEDEKSPYVYNNILPKNINAIIKKEYNFDDKLIFSGLLKTNDGNITFYFPGPAYEPLGLENTGDFTINKHNCILFKKMFGTNITNPEFYRLYPKEEMIAINNENIIITNNSAIEDTSLIDGEYYYCPTSIAGKLTFKFRQFVDSTKTNSRWGDYYIDFDSSRSFDEGYNFSIVKTTTANFPDSHFYLSFVNDRTYDPRRETIEDGLLTDEDALQNYMEDKKVLATEINFLQPYFRTFDIAANIEYNANYSINVVREAVDKAVNKEFGLENLTNISIGNKISKSKLYKTIMDVEGVETVNITYFGFNYEDIDNNPNQEYELSTDFYELALLYSPDIPNAHGKIFNYSKYNASEYGA